MTSQQFENRFSDPRYKDPAYYNRKKHENGTDQKILDSLKADFGVTDLVLDDILYVLNEMIVDLSIARAKDLGFTDRLKSFFRRG